MGRYLHYFDTYANFIDAYKNEYEEPWVSCISGDSSVKYNFPKYVDMGFRSRTLWQGMNVGAAHLYDPGYEFKWGETSPSTYADEYIYGSRAPYRKYNPTDGMTTLLLDDDAAYVAYENDEGHDDEWYASMPTPDQLSELRTNCTISYDMANNATIFTSNINGKQLIFPATEGRQTKGKPYLCIWANKVNPNYTNYPQAYALMTHVESQMYNLSIEVLTRHSGLAYVRGVLNPVLK